MKQIERRTAIAGIGALIAGAAFAAPAPRARQDLYQCEGCEAVHERDATLLVASARLASLNEPGERFILEGIVYASDGKTPAGNIVVYAHHTNADGLYANGTTENVWSRRHGRLRGWVRTGADGRYRFDTVKPAPYPTRDLPAHVHLMIGEPSRPPYYIDDVVFEGEFGVTKVYRQNQELRGGSGIVRLAHDDEGVLLARRDIVLER